MISPVDQAINGFNKHPLGSLYILRYTTFKSRVCCEADLRTALNNKLSGNAGLCVVSNRDIYDRFNDSQKICLVFRSDKQAREHCIYSKSIKPVVIPIVLSGETIEVPPIVEGRGKREGVDLFDWESQSKLWNASPSLCVLGTGCKSLPPQGKKRSFSEVLREDALTSDCEHSNYNDGSVLSRLKKIALT